MKEIKEELKNLFESHFTNELVCNMISQIKENLIDADFFCDDIVNIADELCTRDYRIEKASAIKRCNRKVFRNLDFYVFLQEALMDGIMLEETFEINDFVNEFAENCAGYTGLNFSVKTNTTEPFYIKVNKNFMVFILLMQVRNALIKGAKSIRFSYTVDDGFVNLSLKFNKPRGKNPFSCLEEDTMQHFLYDISNLLATQIHSEVSALEYGAVIKIPEYDHMMINADKEKFIDDEFYLYTIMLSEFSDYLFYK